MQFVIRLIASCLIGIAFVMLIFLSFISSKQEAYVPSFHYDILGSLPENNITFHNISESIKIFSTQEDITIQNHVLQLQNGHKYFSSLSGSTKNLSYSSDLFSLEQEGLGKAFIDLQTRDDRVFVYSHDSIVRLTLHNQGGSEKYTEIVLYPHMYIEFQATRGKFLKNADRVRVETVYKIGYIGSGILTSQELPSETESYLRSDDSFVYEVINQTRKYEDRVYDEMKELQSMRKFRLPGVDLIERYTSLFINDEKKKVYLKNALVGDIVDLLVKKEIHKPTQKRISDNFSELKSLDISTYTELQQFYKVFLANLYGVIDSEYVGAKIALSSVEKTIGESEYFPLYLYSLYGELERDISSDPQVYSDIFQSFPFWSKKYDTSPLEEYFVFYLERNILSSLTLSRENYSVKHLLLVLQKYIETSAKIYKKDNISRITGLYVYSEILVTIADYLRNYYFEAEKSEANLLVLNTGTELTNSDVIMLKNLTGELYKFYRSNQNILGDNARDRGIKKQILTTDSRMKEYFQALENYEKYLSEYDLTKKNLLSYGSNDTEDSSLTEEKFKQYMQKFSGVIFSGMQLDIVDDTYYSVSDITISGKKFRFDMYPFSSHRVTNIVINGEVKRSEYKLDIIEEQWEDKLQTAPQELKSSYDISKFFYNTFLKTQQKVVEEVEDEDVRKSEDKTEIVFKRDRLLGVGATNGEFETFYDTIQIAYDDIELQRVGNLYNIFVQDAPFSLTSGATRRIYAGTFSGQYMLSDTDHYFKNATLKIYLDPSKADRGFMWEGKALSFSGKLESKDIPAVMKEIFENLGAHDLIMRNVIGYDNVSIRYDVFTKKIRISFASNGNNYTIDASNGEMLGIYKGSSLLQSGDISPEKISLYIR